MAVSCLVAVELDSEKTFIKTVSNEQFALRDSRRSAFDKFVRPQEAHKVRVSNAERKLPQCERFILNE